MTTDYVHVELFSSLPYSGNSLAVFPDARGLTAMQMLRTQATGFRCAVAELLSGQPASELVRPGHSVCAWCKTASEAVGSEIYDRSVCGRVPVERRRRQITRDEDRCQWFKFLQPRENGGRPRLSTQSSPKPAEGSSMAPISWLSLTSTTR